MKPSILLTTQWPLDVTKALEIDYHVIKPNDGEDFSMDEIVAHSSSVDAICPAFYNPFDATLIEQLSKRVKLLASFGVGTNHIDVKAAVVKGLLVSNTPDVLTNATADIAIGLMISTYRRFYDREMALRNKQWPGASLTQHLAHDISGKTLGIIGMGRIGQAVAKRAGAFDMPVKYWSRHRKPEIEADLNLTFCDNMEELIASVDCLSLHTALTDDTHHLINTKRLKMMKKDSVLINTGRGPLVDEAALCNSLESGHLWGAGLDVYEFEPKVNERLMALKNVTLLPHIGSATHETRSAMGFRVKENLDRYFAGQPLLDFVSE